MPWNLHEPSPGQFDFSGMLDIERFISLAEKLGLYVIIRPVRIFVPSGNSEAYLPGC